MADIYRMQHIKKESQRGFFDEENRLSQLSKQNDPLEKLNAHIDFEFFRKDLMMFFDKDKDYSKGGRPSFDYVMMFKILVLQRYYNISDDGMEYAVLDRLSFMRFLNLTLIDKVPDAKTIWNFRDRLTQSDMIRQLFDKLDNQLDKDGIIVHKGKMIDATIVQAPIQRNTREENKKLKEGKIPTDWKNNPNKLRQKDTDAKWMTKGGVDSFGYKDHIKADSATKLITNYEVTSAEVHDSKMTDALTDKREDAHQPFYADSAYRSEEIEMLLKKKNIESRVHEKGYRNHPLTEKQKKNNRRKSKVRARVEHIFGFMTNTMNAMKVRCRSITRASGIIGLNNLTYNLFRLLQLKICLRT